MHLFSCVSVCLSAYLPARLCVHHVMQCLRMPKKVLNSLELELQAAVSHRRWVLGTELMSK